MGGNIVQIYGGSMTTSFHKFPLGSNGGQKNYRCGPMRSNGGLILCDGGPLLSDEAPSLSDYESKTSQIHMCSP